VDSALERNRGVEVGDLLDEFFSATLREWSLWVGRIWKAETCVERVFKRWQSGSHDRRRQVQGCAIRAV